MAPSRTYHARSLFTRVLLLAAVAANSSPAAEKEAVDLLRLPSAKLEKASISRSAWPALAALTDGNPDTFAVAAARVDAPLEIVFGFGGTIVSPEKITIRFPRKDLRGAFPARVEVRVSVVSPDAGFQFVRADPLQANSELASFPLPQVAAKWIALRFTPAGKASSVAVAKVALLGRVGLPQSRYEFKESPARALEVLARMRTLSNLSVKITADEEALFEDAKNGKLTKWSFADAALLGSGVTEATQRQQYLLRLDQLEKEARRVTDTAKTPLEKGEKLLHYLHAGPMKNGYLAHQTDVSAILDTGKFNCVSSATLYNILGRRLGLDLRAIEVPDHAFSILYAENEHADVETTSAGGFNPARDLGAQKELEAKTGFRYIPDSHRDQRREVGEAGIVAITYYNHGVELMQARRYHEALLAYFRAMSLDPEFASAVKNALAVLSNWSVDLAKGGKFEEALVVSETGVELAPKDAALLHNRKLVWGEWADALMAKDKPNEAVAVLHRASKRNPGDAAHFLALQAGLYLRPGEELAKTHQWEKALAAVEPGFATLDKGPQEELRHWQDAVRLRWANFELDRQNFEKALGVLEDGRKRNPKYEHFTNNYVYTVQEWVRTVNTQHGEQAARDLLIKQIKRAPEISGLRSVAKNHVYRLLEKQRDAGNFEEALAVITRHMEFLRKVLAGKAEAEAREMAVGVYDHWARKVSAGKQWQKAVDVYAKALGRFPNDSHLRNNLVYTVQEWAKDVAATGDEEKARKILQAEADRFPELADLGDVAKGHVHRLARTLREAGKFEEALAAIERNQLLFKKGSEAEEAYQLVYDDWARSFLRKDPKDWQAAVDIYARALKERPKDGHLKNNLVYTVQEWSKELPTKSGGEEARHVLLEQVKRFADLSDVRDVAKGYVRRLAAKLCQDGKFEEALDSIQQNRELLPRREDVAEAAHSVYDDWAGVSLKRQPIDWQGAIDVYAKGLKAFPKDSHLENNAVYAWDKWARSFFDKDWQAAAQIYEKALRQFPESFTLQTNLKFCQKKIK